MEPYINPYYPAGKDKIDDIPLDDSEHCDFCQEKIKDDEEERTVTAGDESLTLCEACAENCLD